MNTKTTHTPVLRVHSLYGCELRLLGFAKASDRDSAWAVRLSDGQLGCYYLHQLRSENGLKEIHDYLTMFPELDKKQARAAIAKAEGRA